MAGFRNVVIRPPSVPSAADGRFVTLSRSDGKITASGSYQTSAGHTRSGPKRCPICGSESAGRSGLFKMSGNNYECTVCGSQISEHGGLISNGVTR